ncbi:MAG: beta-CASP ribonuclease aCPSF1 [Nitrososphaerota archaeon]|jgi:KH/beta-lactamase-domain protein|nr:beta-CASP ribonuclease aCPSF1 [Nitrososphaerota archaeon]MDG6963562.1 beta-CASP ribonuclease aCPSF1 [Nitrososphaerota archaeon]MDG6973724.1 beta-CASP ribonuclease aCPSF1 [Nitrososphaerota archaeon]MDG6975308.1 beta-CASP ribonuclease aCPSF1 [Nitrososphaerota archaeon]
MSAILTNIPAEAQITRIEYEGPRIALYTRNPAFLHKNSYVISEIVNSLKKRVVTRTEKSIRKQESDARQTLERLIPPGAGASNYFFDDALGEITIEAENPKVLSQEAGFDLGGAMEQTGWKIRVRKAPHIKSTAIQNVYYALKVGSEAREKFYRELGEAIFRPRIAAEEHVTIKTLGAFQQVGRSCVLVETAESKILLDCGIHPGSRNSWDAYPRLDWADISPNELDAIVVSHAHLDHQGFVPAMYKYGYDGPVYCTEPTLPLMTMLQNDFVKIAQIEGGRLIYDQKDIRDEIQHAITLPYGMVTDISPDIKLVFNNAGHILGSATVHLHIGDGAHNIVYTGDYKYGRTALFDSATWNYPRVETLITESTYGAKEDIMPVREEVEMSFVSAINETLQQGGKVLIPIPAVGRAQEILIVLDQYMRNKVLMEAPVFMEGMISEATAIHVSYADYLSRELRTKILEEGVNPFKSEYFTEVEHPADREEAYREGPAIIMATSGMLEGGPVLDYFEHLAPSEKNKILFVSYQVQGSMGRRVLDGGSQASLMDQNGKIKIVDVKAKVQKADGFSGHSDYNQIIRFVGKVRPKLQLVIVNHGEKRKTENLAYSIQRIYRVPAIHPAVQEAIRVY